MAMMITDMPTTFSMLLYQLLLLFGNRYLKKKYTAQQAMDMTIAIRLKIQTKSSHKTHKSQLLRLDFVNLKSWIAIE